jgi:hypothetical protein
VKEDPGLDEMAEATSLRLQMYMDRMSKFETTLSNILQKLGATAGGLTQNLK